MSTDPTPSRADAPPTEAPADAAAPLVVANPWQQWRSATPARIALGRAGAGMPTDETLRFGWAHAMARDAIHAPLDVDALGAALQDDGWRVERTRSRAPDRATYLRRPDLGRQLDPAEAERLRGLAGHGHVIDPPTPDRARSFGTRDATSMPSVRHAVCDLAIVIGDGLSSLAVARHAVPLLSALRPNMPGSIRIAPVVIASQARVALADEVGEAFGAALAVMLIGERPGLSSPDSLGIYLTHAPRRGRSDAERNCISNVRPAGLGYDAAAFKLAWLMREALRLGETGVALKDRSDRDVVETLSSDGPPDAPPSIGIDTP